MRLLAAVFVGALLIDGCATPAGAPDLPPAGSPTSKAAQPAAPRTGGSPGARSTAAGALSSATPSSVAATPLGLASPPPTPTPTLALPKAPATASPTVIPTPPPAPTPTPTATPTAAAPPTPTATPVPPPPPLTRAMEIRGSAFVVEAEIGAGGTVTWTNRDVAPHTVTSTGGLFDSDFLVEGQSYLRTFPAAGSFPYACRVHPFMQATVIVR